MWGVTLLNKHPWIHFFLFFCLYGHKNESIFLIRKDARSPTLISEVPLIGPSKWHLFVIHLTPHQFVFSLNLISDLQQIYLKFDK